MKQIPVRHINTSQKEPDLAGSFSIRNLADLLEGKDLVQELHRHDFFLALAIKKGSGNHVIDFTSYNIDDHAIFLMRPGQVHQLTLNKDTTGYLLQFRADFFASHDSAIGEFSRKVFQHNFYHLDGAGFEKLLGPLAYIYHEATVKPQNYQEVIKANMGIFFIELTRHIEYVTKGKVNLYRQEKLEVFLALLESNICTHKQVAQYAGMLNLSVYQLNVIVKETLGKTCSLLIDEQIILEAKRCLLATTSQVNQVAYSLGYEDVSYFIRFFKRHTGYSPEAFRQNFS